MLRNLSSEREIRFLREINQATVLQKNTTEIYLGFREYCQLVFSMLYGASDVSTLNYTPDLTV